MSISASCQSKTLLPRTALVISFVCAYGRMSINFTAYSNEANLILSYLIRNNKFYLRTGDVQFDTWAEQKKFDNDNHPK